MSALLDGRSIAFVWLLRCSAPELGAALQVPTEGVYESPVCLSSTSVLRYSRHSLSQLQVAYGATVADTVLFDEAAQELLGVDATQLHAVGHQEREREPLSTRK